ncbi:MAG TPA: 8-amino-7-oxononanoate synthase [Acidimicrobiia bacterium]|nr:8-amino-7-oxononanoate synthase [Acidimicrobiia bacterium]
MNDPLEFVTSGLADLDAASLRRRVRSLSSPPDPEVTLDGRRVILLASNNYLGLANHPRVVAAAKQAADEWGVGAGSARLITGSVELHDELERRLAGLKGTADAVLFSSGYLANLGTVSALVGPGDAVFSDELNHASIIDGCRLSRADIHVYPHCDADQLEKLIADWRRDHGAARVLVATDSVFSMDGDLAPLPDLADVCETYGAMLMVDEAHATGVIGPEGRGAVAHFRMEERVPIIMGTLSKSLGASGGFIAGSKALCDFLRNRARAFIFDTALPPPVVGAALAALDILTLEPGRPERVRERARRFHDELRLLGFDALRPDAAVVPVMVGDARAALDLAARLLELGVLAPAIRPPTVPEGTSRLRCTLMASHTDEHLRRAVDAFAALA